MTVKLLTNATDNKTLLSKPRFASGKIFNKSMVASHKTKKMLFLTKPGYYSISLLSLSKNLIGDFHCNYIKKKYGHKARLSFTGTDNLINQIQTNDVFEDFNVNKDMFDFSGYPLNSRFYDVRNTKLIGQMAHETKVAPITEFDGLMYKM